MDKKTAIILFNLGGPSDLEAVKPFLFNLFNDPAIIRLPNPFRFLLAKYISFKRAPIAREIYGHIGGKSPIVPETNAQAKALEKLCQEQGGETCQKKGDFKVFTAMRYWHPFIEETLEKVVEYAPDEIILLPLYPQYSTTTTESSFLSFQKAFDQLGLNIPVQKIENYHLHPSYIAAHVEQIEQAIKGENTDEFRLLFSAHGLPKKIVDAGDPYQQQVEENCEAIMDILGSKIKDFKISYQSRVGRLEWIGPSTENEILQAAKDGKKLIIVPIAFVSEHSETLVELDIEYKELALNAGIKDYKRVKALSVNEKFIGALKELVMDKANG